MSPPFHALIIGGSVAGLTLAHMFERANISYTLFEARDSIDPQLGASIVIMPNGGRIMDQMGLYEGMKETFMTPMARSWLRRPGGSVVGENEWPRLVEERLGYICGICERKQFLKSLYDQLRDKSRIRLTKKVVGIDHARDSVMVKCEDGSEFMGDMVIGADGIHSRTRKEMQRHAEETGEPGMMTADKNCITAEYSCIFGISSALPDRLQPGDTHVVSDIDNSTLLFVGKHSLPQWFLFSKLPSKSQFPNIPRFTRSDLKSQTDTFADFHFSGNVTLKDLVDRTTALSYFPLEEANHEHWTYGRIVCVGDAIHKMTPNLGQGGNQAIESAAVLTNCLVEMLGKGGKIGEKELGETLRRYQEERKARSKVFVKISGAVTRMEALATLKHTLRFLYMEPLSGEMLADIQTEMYHTAPYLEFLPLPQRTKDNELWLEGLERIKEKNNVPFPRPAKASRL